MTDFFMAVIVNSGSLWWQHKDDGVVFVTMSPYSRMPRHDATRQGSQPFYRAIPGDASRNNVDWIVAPDLTIKNEEV